MKDFVLLNMRNPIKKLPGPEEPPYQWGKPKKMFKFCEKVLHAPFIILEKDYMQWRKQFWITELKKKGSSTEETKWSFEKTIYFAYCKTWGRLSYYLGMFLWYGVRKLVPIDGRMDATYYNNILAKNLEESSLQVGIEDDYIFQQDNDPKHTVKKTKKYFSDNNINVLEWPPQRPNLNPSENLRCHLDEKITLKRRHKKEEFLNDLRTAFDMIDVNYLQHLVESIPRHLEAVIVAKEHNTKY